MGWNDSSANTRSRVVRLRFARRLAGVEDIRLKGVAKWTEVTFEMVRNRMRAPLAPGERFACLPRRLCCAAK